MPFAFRRKSVLVFMALAFMCFSISAGTAADNPGGEKSRSGPPRKALSIEDAIELALQKNRALQTARRSVSLASSSLRSARAQYFPGLNGSLNGSQGTGQDILGATVDSFTGGGGVTLDLPLDFSGTINRSVQRSLISLVAAKANYISRAQDLVVQIYREYYDILRAGETIAINQAQVDFAEEQLRIAQSRFNLGRAPEVDVLTAQVQLNSARQDLKLSEGQYEISMANLRKTLLIGQGTVIVPTSSLRYEPETYDFKASVAEALEQRPEIKIAKLNVESAKIALTSADDPYRPAWNIGGDWKYDTFGTSFSNAYDNRPTRGSWSILTGLNIPLFLFDGGGIRENRTQALINLKQARSDLEEARESIELEIRNELTSLENTRDRVQIVQDNIKLARESLRITELRYKMGKTNYLELTDARNNLRTSELNLLNAIIEHSISQKQFQRAVGRPLVE